MNNFVTTDKCFVIEFLGLPGIGKTRTANMLAERLVETTGRARLRGDSSPGSRGWLVRLVFVRPLDIARIFLVTVLTGAVAIGSFRQRLARMARMATGLLHMLNAAHNHHQLIMDEGPLVWLSAIRWGNPRLARFVITYLARCYSSVFRCRVVCLVGNKEILAQHRKIRALEKKETYGKDSFKKEARSHPLKQTDFERERSHRLLCRILTDQGVCCRVVVVGEEQLSAILSFTGWFTGDVESLRND